MRDILWSVRREILAVVTLQQGFPSNYPHQIYTQTVRVQETKVREFNNFRILTCLFVRLPRCKNSCVASYASVSTP